MTTYEKSAWMGSPPLRVAVLSPELMPVQLDGVATPPLAPFALWFCAMTGWFLATVYSVTHLFAPLLDRSLWFYPLVLVAQPWFSLATWLVMALGCKWLGTGRFVEDQRDPFGSWRECWHMAANILIVFLDFECEALKGTFVYNLIQMMMGVNIGRRVCWLGAACAEPDMLTVGDEVIIGPGVDWFAHNIESAAYEYEPVTIEAQCVMGERSSVMGHSVMRKGARLHPLAQVCVD